MSKPSSLPLSQQMHDKKLNHKSQCCVCIHKLLELQCCESCKTRIVYATNKQHQILPSACSELLITKQKYSKWIMNGGSLANYKNIEIVCLQKVLGRCSKSVLKGSALSQTQKLWLIKPELTQLPCQNCVIAQSLFNWSQVKQGSVFLLQLLLLQRTNPKYERYINTVV